MAFDFDTFINGVCIGNRNDNGTVKAGVFGKVAKYTPLKRYVMPFEIAGDFHKDYEKAKPDTMDETVITSEQLRFVVRCIDFPKRYPEAQQGDFIHIGLLRLQIVDIRQHIPGSQTLFLHEVI